MAVAMGEGHAKLVEELVQGLLEFYGGRGELTGPGVAGEGGGEVAPSPPLLLALNPAQPLHVSGKCFSVRFARRR